MVTKVVISCRVDAFAPEPISAEMLDGVLAKKGNVDKDNYKEKNPLSMRKVPLRSLAQTPSRTMVRGRKARRGRGVSNHSHWRLRLVISSSLRAASQRHLLRT